MEKLISLTEPTFTFFFLNYASSPALVSFQNLLLTHSLEYFKTLPQVSSSYWERLLSPYEALLWLVFDLGAGGDGGVRYGGDDYDGLDFPF